MAVYTHLTQDEIGALVTGEYGLGPLAYAQGITQGVENTNYLIAVGEEGEPLQKFILTLYEKRMNLADLPFFIGLMRHLAARGVSCPVPIARCDGAFFGPVRDKTAAIISFLHGEMRTDCSAQHTASVGDALAQVHRAGSDFAHTRSNALSLGGWQALYAALAGTLDTIAPGLEALVRDELAYLTTHWPTPGVLPEGVIHADLFPDNVFFVGDAVSGVIDFYFACTDMLAYDLAITLNAWCFDEGGTVFNAAKSQWFLQAYQAVRPLEAAETHMLPLLLRGAALRFLLTRAYDWTHRPPGAQVVVKDPLEYAAKLRFHQQVTTAEIYGVKV